jgi:hypothetical protein
MHAKISTSIVVIIFLLAVVGFWLFANQRFQAATVTAPETTEAGTGTSGTGTTEGGTTGGTTGGATQTCTTTPEGGAAPTGCETGGTTGGTTGGGTTGGGTTGGNTNGNTNGNSNGNESSNNNGGGSSGGTSGNSGGSTGGSTGGSGGSTGSSSNNGSVASDNSSSSEDSLPVSETSGNPTDSTEKVATGFGSLFSSATSGLLWTIFIPLFLLDLLILFLLVDVRRRVKHLESTKEAPATPVSDTVTPSVVEEQSNSIPMAPVEIQPPAAPTTVPPLAPMPPSSAPLEIPPQAAAGLVIPPMVDQTNADQAPLPPTPSVQQ